MERKNIAYTKGITRSPSDVLCQDGELAECINLEIRNEELVPMEMPLKLEFSLEEGEKLLLIHNIIAGPKNYLISDKDSNLKAFVIKEGIKQYLKLNINLNDIRSIQSIGNTIIVYTEDSPHYFLFKDNDYLYIGSQMPFMDISFGLEGEVKIKEFLAVDIEGETLTLPEMKDADIERHISNNLMAYTNKFIAEESVEKGKFMFPFFVRYAYRLYDGSYTMQSAPILMLPSTLMTPICVPGPIELDIEDFTPKITTKSYLAAYFADLKMKVNNLSSELKSWTDIIKEVSIFVSAPIYTYDQSGEAIGITDEQGSRYSNTTFHGSYTSTFGNKSASGYDGIHNLSDIVKSLVGDSMKAWNLPARDLGDIYNDISECARFHEYISFDINKLDSKEWTLIDPEEYNVNPISAIETKLTLTDDYMSHDKLVPSYSFIYNKRLNISDITRHLFNGFTASSISQPGIASVDNHTYKIYTYIHSQNGTDIIVEATSSFKMKFYGSYLFYPDTDAYKMSIVDTTNDQIAEVPLSQHRFLNGSFAFSGFNTVTFQPGQTKIGTTSNIEKLPNKLFTSEVNNPFMFPLEGINTIGTGNILALSAVTVPISQGQFGQYPLMAFCSDGNFALEVDDQGYYARISPIQEDLLLDSDKITSMENSVAIITKKGIMIVTGAEMTQIASQMDGGTFRFKLLEQKATDVHADLINLADDEGSFLDFLYDARMAYDYSSNRLLIYNPQKTFSYVYSFDNGTVSKMTLDGNAIITSVIDYPDTLIQDNKGNLYSLYEKQDVNTLSKAQEGVAVTRPIKLDNPLTFKNIYDIRNLGKYTAPSSVKYNLYGSMDGERWNVLKSLRGKSYKYYRMAIYTSLLPKETFSGTALGFYYRMSHRFR